MKHVEDTLDQVREGITPVVAIVLLLILTIIVVFTAWTWGLDILEMGMGQAEEEWRTEVDLRGLSCEDNSGDDVVDVLVINRGDTTIDTSQVDIFIYDADDNLVHSDEIGGLFTNDLNTSSGNDRADITYDGPSGWDDFESGQLYEVEFEFPNANDHTVSDTCRP